MATHYTLLKASAITQIQEDLENAVASDADRAEAARDIAEGYTSDAVSQGNVPIYASAATVEGHNIPPGITAFRTNGETTPGDGKGSLYIESDSASGTLQSGDGRWWVEATVRDHGTYSSVADVQNSHIPAVLESIRTLGRDAPGDGGGALLIEGSSSDPGAIQDADGKWWRVAEKVVRPQMFGAKGDGTTDDQDALEAAVNFALLTGAEIHWPDNDFVSTGNIPGFWSVQHSGPGRINRNGETFYITPTSRTQKNTIHVAPAGGSANDGLGVGQPTTLNRVVRSIFPSLGEKASCGQWAIHLLPGTYDHSTAVRAVSWPVFVQEVEIYGDTVGGVRQAVIDGQGASEAWWWNMSTATFALIPNVHFRDLHFKNWDPGSLGGAVVVSGPSGNVTETGCLFEDCYYGIWRQGGGDVRVRGRYIRCQIGVRVQYHAKVNVGTASQRAYFEDCSIAGVDMGRLSAGSVGWADFYGCAVGVRGEQNSRTEIGDIYGEGWTRSFVYLRSGATLSRQDEISYDENSVTPLTPVIRYESGALDLSERVGTASLRHRLFMPSSPLVVSGFTDRRTLEGILGDGSGNGTPFRLPEYRLWTKGLQLELDLVGEVAPYAGGTITLQLTGAGSSGSEVVARTTWSGGTTPFRWLVRITVGETTWLTERWIQASYGPFENVHEYRQEINSPPNTLGKGTGAYPMRLYIQPSNVDTALTIHKMETRVSN